MFKTRALVAALLCGLTVPLLAAGNQKQLPRVYVYTSDAGDAGDVRERQESVRDLQSSLRAKGKHLVVIDDVAQSDITVAVLERVVGHPKAGISLFPPRAHGPRSVVQLRVRLTRGGHSVDLAPSRWRGESDEGWAAAAGDTARLIDKWIANHPAPKRKSER